MKDLHQTCLFTFSILSLIYSALKAQSRCVLRPYHGLLKDAWKRISRNRWNYANGIACDVVGIGVTRYDSRTIFQNSKKRLDSNTVCYFFFGESIGENLELCLSLLNFHSKQVRPQGWKGRSFLPPKPKNVVEKWCYFLELYKMPEVREEAG